MSVEVLCEQCRQPFTTNPKRPRRYCSIACVGLSRRNPNPPARNGYRMRYAPGHPVTPPKSVIVPEHRIVLWEKIGPGSHPCHHCSQVVTWMPGSRFKRGALVSDHLDGDILNNSPDNLVPSCQGCNAHRTRRIGEDDPQRVTSGGNKQRGIPSTCEGCHQDFVAWRPSRPGEGRFCSRTCATRASRIPDSEPFIIEKNGKRVRGVQRTCEFCSTEFVARKNSPGRFCSHSCQSKFRWSKGGKSYKAS